MPNQLKDALKNKKLVLMGGIGLAVIIVLLSVLIIFSKGCKKKIPPTSAAKTESSGIAKPASGAVASPEATAAKPAATGVASEQNAPSSVAPSTPDQAASLAKKKYKWTKKKRIKDVPTLIAMLKKALDKGDDKSLNLALKSLVLQGEDVVELLKGEIVGNFSRPDIRRNAVWGLFYIDDPDVIPVIKTTIKVDPDEGVRFVALFVLYSMLKDDAGFFEDISKTDSSEKIRLKAQEYFRIKSINQ